MTLLMKDTVTSGDLSQKDRVLMCENVSVKVWSEYRKPQRYLINLDEAG